MWSCGFRCGEYRDCTLGLYTFDRGLKQGLLHESYGVRNYGYMQPSIEFSKYPAKKIKCNRNKKGFGEVVILVK